MVCAPSCSFDLSVDVGRGALGRGDVPTGPIISISSQQGDGVRPLFAERAVFAIAARAAAHIT